MNMKTTIFSNSFYKFSASLATKYLHFLQNRELHSLNKEFDQRFMHYGSQ